MPPGDSMQSVIVQVLLCNASVVWKTCIFIFGFCYIFNNLTLKLTSSPTRSGSYMTFVSVETAQMLLEDFRKPLVSLGK